MNARIETVTVWYVQTLDRGRVGPIHHRGIAESLAEAEDKRRAEMDRRQRMQEAAE